jgi:hypothetical protein
MEKVLYNKSLQNFTSLVYKKFYIILYIWRELIVNLYFFSFHYKKKLHFLKVVFEMCLKGNFQALAVVLNS